MKKFNEVTLTRRFSDCRFEDVENLIKYWDDHNYEGLINMKIEPEYYEIRKNSYVPYKSS